MKYAHEIFASSLKLSFALRRDFCGFPENYQGMHASYVHYMPLHAIWLLIRMVAYTKIFIYINNKHRFLSDSQRRDKNALMFWLLTLFLIVCHRTDNNIILRVRSAKFECGMRRYVLLLIALNDTAPPRRAREMSI